MCSHHQNYEFHFLKFVIFFCLTFYLIPLDGKTEQFTMQSFSSIWVRNFLITQHRNCVSGRVFFWGSIFSKVVFKRLKLTRENLEFFRLFDTYFLFNDGNFEVCFGFLEVFWFFIFFTNSFDILSSNTFEMLSIKCLARK